MEPKATRRVRVTESHAISRPTVTGLMEAFQEAFRGRDKPVRVLYTKGENLLVERSVMTEDSEDGGSLVTPYQMVRQYAELEIQEILEDPLLACCSAVQELRSQGAPATFIVVQNKEQLSAWLPGHIRLGLLFGVEIFEDPETADDCLFFCGSQISPMIQDVEKAICCRMV